MLRRAVLLSTSALALAAASAHPLGAQNTVFRGFADVVARTSLSSSGDPSQFALGQLDFFMASTISERVGFMGEAGLDHHGSELTPELDRLLLRYRLSPKLEVLLGKNLAPVSHWNSSYHHGALLFPTIDRPIAVRFEAEGGPLPAHSTGVTLRARDVGALHLGADLMLSNGIGASSTGDNNNAKAVNLQAYSQVTSTFRIGGSVYHDQIGSGSTIRSSNNTLIRTILPGAGDTLTHQVNYLMTGAFAVITSSRLKAMAELFHISTTATGHPDATADYGYLFAGIPLGRLMPYARVEFADAGTGNEYLQVEHVRTALVGSQIELNALAVIKLELVNEQVRAAPSRTTLKAQFAVGF